MALPLSQFPVSSSFTTSPRTIPPYISSRIKPTPTFTQSVKYWSITTTNKKNKFAIFNSTKEDSQDNNNLSENSEPETVSTQQSPPNEPSNRSDYTGGDNLSELGLEIKKEMKEREKKEGGDFWSGVAEEIGEIEWPAFNKVLGTTGVVLGVIAGSSVALLTVNAVLAELSDRVFAGRGVQDFFG